MSGTRWLMSSSAYYSLESLNCAQKQTMKLNDWIETVSDDKQRLPLFTEHLFSCQKWIILYLHLSNLWKSTFLLRETTQRSSFHQKSVNDLVSRWAFQRTTCTCVTSTKVVNDTLETLKSEPVLVFTWTAQNPPPPHPQTPPDLSLLESRARRVISSRQKWAKWELMGKSSANTGGHYEWKAITQIKYTLGGKGGGWAGIWRRNTNYKKAGGLM